VLVPLVEKEGELYLLYEVRAEHMKRQPGEVCFPGGQIEKGESFEQCAVRETMEELGVEKEDIRIIHQLDTVYTYSNFTMFSFLGTINHKKLQSAIPNPEEVKEMFLVPLAYLLEHEPLIYHMRVEPVVADNFPYEKIKMLKGYSWRKGMTEVPIYEFEDKAIWGLTGRITRNFIQLLKSEEVE
jgi:8-oxo-dGTP pyrophosphatase MutT (NUDIX family)